jgi:hypothetical protein
LLARLGEVPKNALDASLDAPGILRPRLTLAQFCFTSATSTTPHAICCVHESAYGQVFERRQ